MQSLSDKFSAILSHVWDNRPSDKFTATVANGTPYLFEVQGNLLFCTYDFERVEMVFLLTEEYPQGEHNSRTPLIRAWYPTEMRNEENTITTAIYLDGDSPSHHSPLTLRRLLVWAEQEVLRELSFASEKEPMVFESV